MIKIFVGCAANNEDLESQAVLEYTLTKYASEEFEITWMMQSRDPNSFWYGWNTLGWATPFSGFRWGVPAACGFQGRAIYMDSDMIVQGDIAELWRTPITPPAVMVSKGDNARFCVTLFDCARIKQHMLPIDVLRRQPGAHRTQRMRLANAPRLIQPFGPNDNWNCCDGEGYSNLADPRIKCHHYTAIATQPQLKYAIPRLIDEGQSHWFKGTVQKHWRQDVIDLFDKTYAEAISAGFLPDNYRREPFGEYAAGGSAGGAWQKGMVKKAMGR